MAAAVPVTILAGFLGAGKTTLLNRVLRESRGVRYGVLVNDFAALNIDAELIADAGPDRIALTNGCVCCTIRDDLLAAALDLARAVACPDRILIECSGVSDPRAVARALTGELAGSAFAIDAMVCLVDSANVMALGYAETEAIIDQAAAADVVLITKCDLADRATIDDVERLLREAQPTMRIARTSAQTAPLELISGSLERDTARHDPAHTHAAPHRTDHFNSRAWQTERPLSLDAFTDAVRALPGAVFRAKGVLHFADHPRQRAVFHLVGRRSELTFEPFDGDVAASALVAIGRADTFDAQAFDRLFDAAAAPRIADIPSTVTTEIGGMQ